MSATKIEMSQVKEIPLEKLKPHPRNDQIFRIESEGYFQDVMEDMKKNGQIQPIIVDKHNKVLAGHNRLKVAQKLKWKTLKAQVVTKPFKSEADEIRFMVSEQLKRRHFGPQDRLKVYQMAFPNLADRVLVSTSGRPKANADDSFGLNARQVSEATGVNLATVSADLHKFRKYVRDLKGLTKTPLRMGNSINKMAVAAVKRSCTAILRSTLQENKKTQTIAAELVQETLSEVRAGMKKSK